MTLVVGRIEFGSRIEITCRHLASRDPMASDLALDAMLSGFGISRLESFPRPDSHIPCFDPQELRRRNDLARRRLRKE